MSEKNNLQIAYQNANVFFEKKDYQSSINQLEEIIKIFPNELNSIFLIFSVI
jgi:TolA-binding protein